MKTIICGCRDFNSHKFFQDNIENIPWKITEIVSGGARGADAIGEEYADMMGIKLTVFPAKWNDLTHDDAIIRHGKYGKYDAKAGFRRNQTMADYAQACICYWDGKSSGSRDMLERAGKAGLQVHIELYDKETIKEMK